MSLPPLTPTAWLRYDAIRRLLDGLPTTLSVLEIGVGEGAMGARLANRYKYLGLEPDAVSFRTASTRIQEHGGRLICGEISAIPPDESFDLVCAFEVLEHIEDDRSALKQWRARIKPEGWLLISVPAFQSRFGPWDEKAGHFRRYEPRDLGNILVASGFTPLSIDTYGFPLGSVLEWVRHRTVRGRHLVQSMVERTASSGRALQPPEALAWATQLGTAPFRMLQRPFARSEHGIGLVVLARRSDEGACS